MKLTIMLNQCELSALQIQCIESTALANSAGVELTMLGKKFDFDTVGITPSEVPRFDAVFQQVRAICNADANNTRQNRPNVSV